MIELPFQHFAPEYIRIQTHEIVGNDLSIRVNEHRVYDPRTDRNTATFAQLTEPVPEGATIYVDAFKGFGVAYRLSTWEAAINLRGTIRQTMGGLVTENVTAGNDYYPMGNFVPPHAFVVELSGLEPGVSKKTVLEFASGAIQSETWVPTSTTETRELRHERRDKVTRVWLLDIDEEFLPQ